MQSRIIKQGLIDWRKCEWFQPENLKKYSKGQWDKLKTSLKNNGLASPFIVWENEGINYILDAHHRHKAMIEMIEIDHIDIPVELPAVWIDCKDKQEAKKAVMIYNSHYANFQKDELVDWISDLNFDDFDNEIAFKIPDIEEFKEIQKGSHFLDAEDELEGAFQLKDKVKFESDNFWGIPNLDENKLVKEIDFHLLETYCGQVFEDNKIYLYLYNSDVLKQDFDTKRSILGFYVDDYRFEQIWVDPVKYTTKLLNLGFNKSLGVNFSLYRDDSRAFQLVNVYKSRWCTRYLQMAGIDIIPDINFSDEESYDYCFLGLPKNAPIYIIQFQNHRDQESIDFFKKGLKKAVDILNPKNIIIYLSKGREELIKDLQFDGINIYYLYNRSSIKKYGGQHV